MRESVEGYGRREREQGRERETGEREIAGERSRKRCKQSEREREREGNLIVLTIWQNRIRDPVLP